MVKRKRTVKRSRKRRVNRKFYRKRKSIRKRGRFAKKKRSSAISKLFKTILPSVPVKSTGAFGVVGSYGCRVYKADFVGELAGVVAGRDYLPNQSAIYDDGAVGTSTHMSFQQYAAKKYKAKHTKRYIGQNLGNGHMLLTIYIATPRHDYIPSDHPDVNELFPDCLTSTSAGQDFLQTGSALPAAGSTIVNYYNYTNFTPFMSNHFTTSWLVLKTYRMRLAPGEWFKFNMSTKLKEFDKKWLLANDAYSIDQRIKLPAKYAKMALFTWHGEAVTKGGGTEATDVNTITLAKNDLMVYYNHTWLYKAVPHHMKSIRLLAPSNIHTEDTIAAGQYLVRPTGVVQVSETSHDVKPE